MSKHEQLEGMEVDWDNDDLLDDEHDVSDEVRKFLGLKEHDQIWVTKVANTVAARRVVVSPG